MPRTATLESPGCPPLRALTCDVLGLVKVIETRGEGRAVPRVVERWGEPDSSKCVLSASILDRESDPLLGVARKDGSIEVLSAMSGDLRVSIPHVYETSIQPEDDAVVGLHLFRKQRSKSSSGSCTLLTCTKKGHGSIRSVEIPQSIKASACSNPPTTWNVCSSGCITFSKVDGDESFALFGGKGVELNLWDLDKCAKIWTSKSPAKNTLGIFTPTWFTCSTFLSRDDHRKFVAGTHSNQVRLYDIASQRRPVISFDFRDTAIKAVSEDPDGQTIYVGNGSGDLASIDIRTGKLLGCFLGKCSGSIRSIARHSELPVIASCGLDSFLRIWDIKSRQLLSAVFLKQHLSDVFFDSHYRSEEISGAATNQPLETKDAYQNSEDDEEGEKPLKRKKASKEHRKKKKTKSNKKSKKSKGEVLEALSDES